MTTTKIKMGPAGELGGNRPTPDIEIPEGEPMSTAIVRDGRANGAVVAPLTQQVEPEKVTAWPYGLFEHSDYWCARPFCLAKPRVDEHGQVWGSDGYHRTGVQSMTLDYGFVTEVGVGCAEDDGFDEDSPIIHMRLINTDAEDDNPGDETVVIMSLEETDQLVEFLVRAADKVRSFRQRASDERRDAAVAEAVRMLRIAPTGGVQSPDLAASIAPSAPDGGR